MLALSLDMGGTHIGCAVVRDKEILADPNRIATKSRNSLAAMSACD